MRKPAWKGSVEGELFRHYPVEGRRMVSGGDILSFSGGIGYGEIKRYFL